MNLPANASLWTALAFGHNGVLGGAVFFTLLAVAYVACEPRPAPYIVKSIPRPRTKGWRTRPDPAQLQLPLGS